LKHNIILHLPRIKSDLHTVVFSWIQNLIVWCPFSSWDVAPLAAVVCLRVCWVVGSELASWVVQCFFKLSLMFSSFFVLC